MAATPTQERPYRVAIVRALPGLGDFLCAVPAFRALRAALPFAQIDLIGLPENRPLVERFGTYLDRLVEFPGYPGIPEVPVDAYRLARFVAEMRAAPYDLVLQMHGDGSRMNDFAASLGSPLVFGFHPPGEAAPDPERFLAYPAAEPEVMRNLRLVEHVGAPAHGSQLEFPLTPLDAAELALITETATLSGRRYAVIHPGASCGEKRWQPEYFAQVADHLAEHGITPVVTGAAAEAALSAAVVRQMFCPALNLTGRTSLGALAVLVSGAALVVANDTGISHLADALAVPSIIVFSASDARRWAPLDTSRHRIVDIGSADGGRSASLATMLARALGEREGISFSDLPLSGVMAEVEYLLAMGGGGVS